MHRFDLRERRADSPLSGVRFFRIAENGEKMLYSQGQGDATRWIIGTLRPWRPRTVTVRPPHDPVTAARSRSAPLTSR